MSAGTRIAAAPASPWRGPLLYAGMAALLIGLRSPLEASGRVNDMRLVLHASALLGALSAHADESWEVLRRRTPWKVLVSEVGRCGGVESAAASSQCGEGSSRQGDRIRE